MVDFFLIDVDGVFTARFLFGVLFFFLAIADLPIPCVNTFAIFSELTKKLNRDASEDNVYLRFCSGPTPLPPHP